MAERAGSNREMYRKKGNFCCLCWLISVEQILKDSQLSEQNRKCVGWREKELQEKA